MVQFYSVNALWYSLRSHMNNEIHLFNPQLMQITVLNISVLVFDFALHTYTYMLHI